MEKLVLTGTVCFCVGLTVGLILGAVVMALAATAKKYKPKTKEIDDCWGGVSVLQMVIVTTVR